MDFVADKRASTPTGAAELATVDQREIYEHLSFALNDMEEGLKNRLEAMKDDLSSLKEDLTSSSLNLVNHQKQLLEHKKATLSALNPENVLNRGYSLTVDEDGHPVSIEKLNKGSKIRTILKDGSIDSEVLETRKK